MTIWIFTTCRSSCSLPEPPLLLLRLSPTEIVLRLSPLVRRRRAAAAGARPQRRLAAEGAARGPAGATAPVAVEAALPGLGQGTSRGQVRDEVGRQTERRVWGGRVLELVNVELVLLWWDGMG